MPTTTQWPRWLGAAFVAATLFGCGSGGNPVYKVQGKVTFEGKPLPGGGSIAFVPLGMQAGKTGGGEIARDGTYRLTTYVEGDGSMAGEFRVVVMQGGDVEPPKTPDGQKAAKPPAPLTPAERIPGVYGDFDKSPLRATVEAKTLNEIDFTLKRDGSR